MRQIKSSHLDAARFSGPLPRQHLRIFPVGWLTAGSEWDQKRHLSWGDVALYSSVTYPNTSQASDQFGRGEQHTAQYRPCSRTPSSSCRIQAQLWNHGFSNASAQCWKLWVCRLLFGSVLRTPSLWRWSSSAFLIYLRSQLAAVAGATSILALVGFRITLLVMYTYIFDVSVMCILMPSKYALMIYYYNYILYILVDVHSH